MGNWHRRSGMRPQAVVVAVAWLAALAVGSADVFPRVYSDPALWARHRQLNDATEAFIELEGEASAKPSLPSAAPHSGDLQVVDKHSPPDRRPDFDLQPHNDEASRSGMVSFTKKKTETVKDPFVELDYLQTIMNTHCTYHRKPPEHHTSYWVENMMRGKPQLDAAEECKIVCDEIKQKSQSNAESEQTNSMGLPDPEPKNQTHHDIVHCTRLCTKVLRVMSYRVAQSFSNAEKKFEKKPAPGLSLDAAAAEQDQYPPGWERKTFKFNMNEDRSPSELEQEAQKLEQQYQSERKWLEQYRRARKEAKDK